MHIPLQSRLDQMMWHYDIFDNKEMNSLYSQEK